ncbi:MAG: transketolase, partial [Burkholderiaceae bacterium]|nr:transketolase [Burkholderiaceae bacterium]
RNAIRMSALMRQRVVYVLTHDSIGLGEDGPTHQPVEHAASLRLIPNLDVWRPCDGVETAVAWRAALDRREGPTALLLSRQNVTQQTRGAATEAAIARGGYVLSDTALPLAVVLIATGSEVELALAAQRELAAQGIGARVVSMPSTSVFDRQDASWQNDVLPPAVPRVAVEAGHPDYWRKYVGLSGRVVGLARFGESAPAAKLYEYFGLTPAAVVAAVREALEAQRARPARIAA